MELAKYGVLAKEHFNEGHLATAKDRGTATLSDYVSDKIAEGALDGQWAVKGSFCLAQQLARLGECPWFHEWLFVYLTRSNLVQQAVSLIIAEASGRWLAWGPTNLAVAAEDYDEVRIAGAIDAIVETNKNWERFFGAFGLRPFRLTYEDLRDDLPGSVARVREFLGLPERALQRRPVAIVEGMRNYLGLSERDMGQVPDTWRKPSSQFSEINRIWEKRFLADQMSRFRNLAT